MARIPYFFSIIIFLSVIGANCKILGTDILPVFEIVLENLIPYNIQILHDGTPSNIDWFNVNVPIKIVNTYTFSRDTIHHLSIDVFKSRANSHYKLAIFISTPFLEVGETNVNRNLNLDDWIYTVNSGLFHYTDILSEFADHNYVRNIQCNDVVMTFVTVQNSKKNLRHVFFAVHQHYKISVVFISIDGQVEICAWSASSWSDGYIVSSLNNKFICNVEPEIKWKRKVSDIYQNIATLSPGWCYRGENSLEIKKDVDTDKNPFNPMDSKSRLGNILKMVFVSANETIVFDEICASYYYYFMVDTLPNIYFVTTIVVITKTSGHQFLSCYRDEYISFKFYITPFKKILWVWLIISLTSIIIITSAYKY